MRPRRIDALRVIADEFPSSPVLTTCGSTSREMASLGRRANHLYVVDSMGLVPSIATGLALAAEGAPVERVVAVEGDGGMLMNLNALTTAGALRPEALLLVVLDNESYESTGGQPTHTATLDLAAVAESCGLRVWRAEDLETFRGALTVASDTPGPGFVLLKIQGGHEPCPYLWDDPGVMQAEFSRWFRERAGVPPA